MAKQLQNIKAVQQMLDGTHKFQTKKIVGFSDAKDVAIKNQIHLIGSTWEEIDPITGTTYVIEQKDGFRIKKTKNSDVLQSLREELRGFPNCRKDTCTCVKAKRIDEKMRSIHGMCFDCTIEFEHELKKAGTYDAYEQQKIRDNALAWLAAAERDVEMLKVTYTSAQQFITNSEGQKESWSAKMTPEEFDETVQQQFDIFKEKFLNNLNQKETNENN